jgi:predicted nucleotide-binding protein (sugar kinase/HSP70/actin superfamily)
MNHVSSANKKWKALYESGTKNHDDIHIMLLGRPYTVLSPAMNNSIPDIIEKMGIMPFYMDMMPFRQTDGLITEDLIRTIKWKFASKILHAAEMAARTENCYPVLITSFKCSPDSFVVEYFKEILDNYRKPYLILQLDEHDSTVGYETRIEAAVRAFRNHRKSEKETITGKQLTGIPGKSTGGTEEAIMTDTSMYRHVKSLVRDASAILKAHSIDFRLFSREIENAEAQDNNISRTVFSGAKNLGNKTLLIPSWDHYTGPLLEAVLKNSNINARLVDSSVDSMQRSLSLNTGQCLPLNFIVQDSIDYIEANGLDPSETAVWMMKTKLSCNLAMFPWFMKKLLEDYGKGMEHVSVYVGDVIFYDFSLQTTINAYLAYMFGGYIRKIACSVRPYEITAGTTDAVVSQSLSRLRYAFLNGKYKEEILEKIISDFDSIPVMRTRRPKVAIFGDLYVRDNDLMNQDMIKTIEENGGEVITTPYSEYMKIIADPIIERTLKEGRYRDYVKVRFLKSLIPLVEEKYKKYFAMFTGEAGFESSAKMDEWLNKFGLNILHKGESFENILKIHSLMAQYPDLDLFIQTNPSYCCPSLVTEAMKSRIEEVTGVPVLTIEYDGTAGFKNEDLIPYLKYRNVRARG